MFPFLMPSPGIDNSVVALALTYIANSATKPTGDVVQEYLRAKELLDDSEARERAQKDEAKRYRADLATYESREKQRLNRNDLFEKSIRLLAEKVTTLGKLENGEIRVAEDLHMATCRDVLTTAHADSCNEVRSRLTPAQRKNLSLLAERVRRALPLGISDKGYEALKDGVDAFVSECLTLEQASGDPPARPENNKFVDRPPSYSD